ncbi:MAG: carboxypeptidase-like regulatory domain-containing protein [Candidatus Zixiibacteriota bacterium]|jgi:hypothetical protein
MPGEAPRNVEVLIHKAAVDPAFKKKLLEKRAGAADDIALTLTAAEAAILEAVPEDQLKAIVGRTRVSPGLRPVFLGYAAAAMLAALATRATPAEVDDAPVKSYGAQPGVPPETYSYTMDSPEGLEVPEGAGLIYGCIRDQDGEPVPFITVQIEELEIDTITNRHGYYVVSPVPPGKYTVVVYVPGAEREKQKDVEVREGMKTDVSLQVYIQPGIELYGSGMGTGIRPDRPDGEGE